MKKGAQIDTKNWWLDRNNEILADPMGMAKIGRVYAQGPNDDGRELGKRIIDCVKAMNGFDNPEKVIDNYFKMMVIQSRFRDLLGQILHHKALSEQMIARAEFLYNEIQNS